MLREPEGKPKGETRHEEEAAKTASGGHGRRTAMFGSVGRARSGRQEMLSASKEELLDLRRESPVSFSGFRVKRKKHGGGLAQLGERLPCKQEVSGSNPLISMKAGR